MPDNNFAFEVHPLTSGFEVKLEGVPEAFRLLRNAHAILEIERESRMIVSSGEVPPLNAPPSHLWLSLNTAAQAYDLTDINVSLGAVDILHRGTCLAANEIRKGIILADAHPQSPEHTKLGRYTLLATKLKPYVRAP